MNLRSSWVAETGQTREDTRLTQTPTTMINPVQVRSGILPGSYSGQWRLSGFWMTGASAMTATVSEGRAVIQGDISQGVYPVTLPASEPVTFTAGNATYGRIDLVVLKVYDKLYDGGTRNEAVVEVIQGVPEASPKAPATPPRSLPLYEVTVPANASAGNGGIPWNTSLKDLRTPVVAAGGILPVEGPVLPGAHPGAYQDAPNNQLQRWDGGKWVAYPEAIGGIVPSSASTLPGSYVGQYRDGAGGRIERWNGSAWAPAVPGPYFTDSLTSSYTTSTTWVNTLTNRDVVSLSFVAPASRQALLSYGSRIQLVGTGSGVGFMGVKVTTGATVHSDVNDSNAVVAASPGNVSMATVQRLQNLTAGATYTVTAYYRGTNSALQTWFNNTYLQVTPQH
ncbi:hypothetical protein [Streptomyces sp. NPDC056194]|uniref:hypothetical protein n=1 Tax=unclassified Streptomyces TaxID=2593676 RepID=UPI0035D7534F